MQRPETSHQHARRPGIVRARRLRREAPFPERALWHLLRDRRLSGLKFRRQHPIGPYFVDFYCAAHDLVLEVDGRSHDERGARDARRQLELERRGLYVLRIPNDEVLDDPESVILAILKAVGIDPDGPPPSTEQDDARALSPTSDRSPPSPGLRPPSPPHAGERVGVAPRPVIPPLPASGEGAGAGATP